jgi:hypothetical protein
MGELIALVLQELDLRDLLFNVLIVVEQGDKPLGSLVNVFGLFAEEGVKLLIAGYELHGDSLRRRFEQGIVKEMLQKCKPVAVVFNERLCNQVVAIALGIKVSP